MARPDDVLELLLPQADSKVVRTARNVTHFLRLLSDDARPQRAGSVCVDLDRARHEFDRQDRRAVERALCDLVRHHLNAGIDADSFAWFGEPAHALQDAWDLIAEYREELPWLAGIPEPDETSLSVAERLCESLRQLSMPAGELALWRTRVVHRSFGPRVAEKAFRAALANLDARESQSAVERALVAGAAECMLDRAAVREAHAWLMEHRASTALDARLRQLLCWCRLCLGDLSGAKALSVGLRPWTGPLPTGLAELRAQRSAWLPCLSGKVVLRRGDDARGASQSSSRSTSAPRERADIGACVLAVFVFRPGLSSHAILCDVSAGLREKVGAWLGERESICTVPSEREHAMVVHVRNQVAHRDGDTPLTGVLGRDATRALALAPVLGEDGEVAGWLHIEWEHHLVPSDARLQTWAQSWLEEVRAAIAVDSTSSVQGALDRTVHPSSGGASSARSCGGSIAPDDPRVQVFRALVHDLGMKTSQRRWFGFEVDAASGALDLVVEGGEAVGLAGAWNGERRALQRALATGGAVTFEDLDPRLSIDATASSGLVLPMCAGGNVCGLLAVESSRRRDFKGADTDRLAADARRSGLALRAGQFRAWHKQHIGFDVWLDPTRAEFRAFADRVLVAGRSRSPVVLRGPSGAGKLVLARWLHFESAHRDGPLSVFRCRAEQSAPTSGRNFDDVARSAQHGSVVVDDIEHLSAAWQEELVHWLDNGRERVESDSAPVFPRLFVTTRMGLADAVRSGALRGDLAHRLDRLELWVPPLKERREDILELVRCLAARFAAEERLKPLALTDGAAALVWRQRWEGNVRELETFVYKLVVFSRGEELDAEHVLEIARQFRIPLERKLPSRHPARSDLIAALRVTRKVGGRMNKTRAALYLGWDPDTLVARIADAGITDESLAEEAPFGVTEASAGESSASPSPVDDGER